VARNSLVTRALDLSSSCWPWCGKLGMKTRSSRSLVQVESSPHFAAGWPPDSLIARVTSRAQVGALSASPSLGRARLAIQLCGKKMTTPPEDPVPGVGTSPRPKESDAFDAQIQTPVLETCPNF